MDSDKDEFPNEAAQQAQPHSLEHVWEILAAVSNKYKPIDRNTNDDGKSCECVSINCENDFT